MQRRHAIIGGIVVFLSALAIYGFMAGKKSCYFTRTRDGDSPKLTKSWVFVAPEPGSVVAAPVADERQVYVNAVHLFGFQRSGAIYALDRTTGNVNWRFDDDGKMLPSGSTPALADGRLYFGEGLHANFVCQFRCLDALTGKLIWQCETNGHIESSPCVADGRVYFGSGDDGLYALDANTGAVIWHKRGDWHVDAAPALAAGRVFVGCGRSRRFNTPQVIAFDAQTGQIAWQTPMELPAWGSPVVSAGRVFVGLGNGRLTERVPPPEIPAGGVAALDATTGQRLWHAAARDAVFHRPVAYQNSVIFAARDGWCRSVRAADGVGEWQCDFASPIVASPSQQGETEQFFVVSEAGMMKKLVRGGIVTLDHDFAAITGNRVRVLAAPLVVDRTIYIAGEFGPEGAAFPALYCVTEDVK